jgi:hypothetical protein
LTSSRVKPEGEGSRASRASASLISSETHSYAAKAHGYQQERARLRHWCSRAAKREIVQSEVSAPTAADDGRSTRAGEQDPINVTKVEPREVGRRRSNDQ